jgi:glyoxylase-like metal-dependent hydrolase (beta-lactamase superfamily II)
MPSRRRAPDASLALSGRPRPVHLRAQLESVAALADVDFLYVLPGHGPPARVRARARASGQQRRAAAHLPSGLAVASCSCRGVSPCAVCHQSVLYEKTRCFWDIKKMGEKLTLEHEQRHHLHPSRVPLPRLPPCPHPFGCRQFRDEGHRRQALRDVIKT